MEQLKSSQWMAKASTEVIDRGYEIASRVKTDPAEIFEALIEVKEDLCLIAAGAVRILGGSDKEAVENLRKRFVYQEEQYLTMIIAYEVWQVENSQRLTCENEYGLAIHYWNIAKEFDQRMVVKLRELRRK